MSTSINILANTLPFTDWQGGGVSAVSLWRAGSGFVYSSINQVIAFSIPILHKLPAPMAIIGNLTIFFFAGKDICFLLRGYYPKNLLFTIYAAHMERVAKKASAQLQLCEKIADHARVLKILPGGTHIYHVIQYTLKSAPCQTGVKIVAISISLYITLSLFAEPSSFFNPNLFNSLGSDTVLVYLGMNLTYASELLSAMLQAPAVRKAKEDLTTWIEEVPDWREKQNRIRAQNRIVKAIRYQDNTLNLDGLSLTTLPPVLWTLSWLTHLKLAHNRLTMLPPQIVRLTHLQKLDVRDNDLQAIPDEIRCLPLSTLDSRGNPLLA